MMPVRILVFAKAPLPGAVKTRLVTVLGEEGAAALATEQLLQTLQKALAANVGPVELCAAPSRHHPLWRQLPLPTRLQWSDQGEGDLGMRMGRAAQRALSGGDPVLLIGTDCPQLTGELLRDAAASLAEYDCCLIPALDGGYVLLGLARWQADLFSAMPWSTAQVADLTRQRMAAAGLSCYEWPALRDIDEPADLQWL
ncbi:TIGR04282 family arsenosugar biosynthesis glycosyltransferase [Pseudomaricurvus sp. HS19]|uniref:TIGR04282 family arsenosugar biosynthesis glycosyltransferase n=1 Tax=Pseudomaricurvus sp. HS19 TaxID=2692626 RepID=UPI00136AE5F1|nr:TIGR04282 family arsenosugar biosynthesis glycosyltransferase [Pseudomaricurvus sp. HS19]MYM64460.1 DUF2064 domain-containing protein [Pseudomaricurvus sp. HS19]